MKTSSATKINHLFRNFPSGTVLLSSWLAENGYSYGLQKRYRKSAWLESIGAGAMKRADDTVGYEGAVYALQAQSGSHIHPGGLTALAFLGKSHYLELGKKRVTLFGGIEEKLPVWFKQQEWGSPVDYYSTSLLPSDIGMVEIELRNFSIKVSGAGRAMIECLYLAPKKQAIPECFEVMEGLNNLNPQKVQSLLEQCTSVKVKRLFLYLADKARHEWFHSLNIPRIDLGKGKRSIVKEGVYIDKYQITVPKVLEDNGTERL